MIRFGLGCIAILTLASFAAVAAMPPHIFRTIVWAVEMGIWLCLAIPVLALVLGVTIWAKRRERRERTYIDGALPILRRKRHFWRVDLHPVLACWYFVVGEEFFIDPNRIVGPAFSFDAFGYVREMTPAVGWDMQHAYNLAVEGTNHLRAALPGDDVRNTFWGKDSLMPRFPARALSASKPKPLQLTGPVEVESSFVAVPISFDIAVRSNTERSLALGQTPNGAIARWNVEEMPHLRVHGKSQGSGKTNLIKTLAVGAIAQGAHVIVLDRRGFKDWHDYRRHIEMVDNRKEGAFAATVKQLRALYQERDELLGKHGAANIGELPNPPQRIFVVVSEFCTACQVADETGEMEQVLPALKSIMSEAGATGIHMIFEDQVITRAWPRVLRGNTTPITGRLPEDSSVAGGYRLAHLLKQYEFHFDDERFTTWNMKVEAPKVLASVPGSDVVLVDVRSFGRSVEENKTAESAPEILSSTEHRTPNATEIQRMIWAWRDRNPNGTQAELRKCLVEDGIEVSRSYVFECWHKWTGTKEEELSVLEQLQRAGVDLNEVYIGDDRLGVDRASVRS